MASLVPTLHKHLERADGLLAAGRSKQARQAFEQLLQAAQDRADRGMEVLARATLARMALQLHDLDEARSLLASAGRALDPHHLPSHRRYRAALARLAVEEGPAATAREELTRYLQWAEDERQGEEVLDASLLLASQVSALERVTWLQRGIEQALALGATERLGEAHMSLAAAWEAIDELADAVEAYSRAHHWHLASGRPRDVVAAAWAVGATASQLEDWARARDALREALRGAEAADDCDDLLALVLADLATVEEAAGDVVEARRLMLRALKRGREQQLATLWPERWATMERQARALEL